ncbi:MAG TPA: hypothetical protein VK988_19055 [Acidimicrobiales bacterium]|nr:hypothetical protein [Acidimicrobiales bacterium]
MNGVETEGLEVVVLGSFNPSIFSPAWLRLHDLIGAREADEAKVQVIVPPAAVFSTEWLGVNVQQDSMSLQTEMTQDFERLRDVAVGILEVLKETPIFALGINRHIHWQAPSDSSYHYFGDHLVPKEFWSQALILPGTQQLTVQAIRPDEWAGYIRVTIQPSNTLRPRGIFAQFNDHVYLTRVESQPKDRSEFQISNEQFQNFGPSQERIPLALALLGDAWTDRNEHAERVLQTLVDLTRQEKEPDGS